MALQKEYVFSGVTVPAAYYRISQVNIQINSATADVCMDIFASEEFSRLGVQERIGTLTLTLDSEEMFVLAGKNIPDEKKREDLLSIKASSPLEWCYKWLMTKPEFREAEAV